MVNADWVQGTDAHVKRLFGKPSRVILASWILSRDERFYLNEAQMALAPNGIVASAVSKDLEDFAGASMLSRSAADNRVYFEKQSNVLWDAFAAIVSATLQK